MFLLRCTPTELRGTHPGSQAQTLILRVADFLEREAGYELLHRRTGEIFRFEGAALHFAVADFEDQRRSRGGDLIESIGAVDHETARQSWRRQRSRDLRAIVIRPPRDARTG
jgi:hypothetical protein